MVALSASAVGFAYALWLCPERALRCFFAVDPVALSPLLPMSFLTVSFIGARFAFAEGRLPLLWSHGALGKLRWLHLYRLTPGLVSLRHFAVSRWCSGRCFILFLRDVPHVFMVVFLSGSLTYECPCLHIPIGLCSLDT